MIGQTCILAAAFSRWHFAVFLVLQHHRSSEFKEDSDDYDKQLG